MRMTILAVPPLIPLIHRDLDMSETEVGILAGLPSCCSLRCHPGLAADRALRRRHDRGRRAPYYRRWARRCAGQRPTLPALYAASIVTASASP